MTAGGGAEEEEGEASVEEREAEPEAEAAGPASGPATPMGAQDVEDAGKLLGTVADAYARGFRAMGMPAAARFEDQQEHRQPVQLDPGKCYALVAYGSVKAYDVHLVIATPPMPPYNVLSLHVDEVKGAVGGTADTCWKNPMPQPMPGTLVMRAREGTGHISARLYGW